MAKVMTIKILYEDEVTEKKIFDVLKKIPVLDSIIEDVEETNMALDDSIANGNYKKGDAFSLWVIRDNNHHDRYWSGEYGWTDIELATRYKSTDSPRIEQSFIKSAYYILDPIRPFR